ncbi:MAG: hypothetical protein H7124_08770 [Phycisphaerales bacterium]|nr:hypothetical protein [Hyphomonadaceae bacterium]
MREYNSGQDQTFADRIDCRFPYNEHGAAQRLIEEARGISLNAAFCVLQEICSPPHPPPVTFARQQELLGQWIAIVDHPLVEAVLPCANALLNREELPSMVAAPILTRVGQHDGQLAALALVLSATDDTAPAIRVLEQEIRLRWEAAATSD